MLLVKSYLLITAQNASKLMSNQMLTGRIQLQTALWYSMVLYYGFFHIQDLRTELLAVTCESWTYLLSQSIHLATSSHILVQARKILTLEDVLHVVTTALIWATTQTKDIRMEHFIYPQKGLHHFVNISVLYLYYLLCLIIYQEMNKGHRDIKCTPSDD